MFIIKNAWKSITRNKGRNILIGLIIVVIGAACAVTLSIRNSANKLVKAYEEKYNVEATLSFNRESLMSNFTPGDDSLEENIEKFNDIESISVENIDNYGDSKYVDYYYYTYSVGMDGKNITVASEELQKITTETKTTTKTSGGGPMPGGGFRPSKSTTTTTKSEQIINMRGTNRDFTLIGYSSYEGMKDFITGGYTITEGEVSSDFTSNNCVINEELASLNELEVGDTITLVDPDNSSLTYSLTITGIFADSSENSSNMKSMFSSSANSIITNSKVVETIVAKDEDISATTTPTFILKSKDVADSFAEEVKEKGLDENYQATNNIDEIESETSSITNVSSFATTFLIITLVIGGVVLFVINMINVRERKYEIGVLRTIGMSKFKVTAQFVTETFIVAIFSLLIGAGIGSTCSVPVANMLLSNEIENSKEESNKIRENFGGMNDKTESTIETDESSMAVDAKEENTLNYGVAQITEETNINAVVDIKVLLELLGIGLGLILISSISSMVSISRFSPLSILKERS